MKRREEEEVKELKMSGGENERKRWGGWVRQSWKSRRFPNLFWDRGRKDERKNAGVEAVDRMSTPQGIAASPSSSSSLRTPFEASERRTEGTRLFFDKLLIWLLSFATEEVEKNDNDSSAFFSRASKALLAAVELALPSSPSLSLLKELASPSNCFCLNANRFYEKDSCRFRVMLSSTSSSLKLHKERKERKKEWYMHLSTNPPPCSYFFYFLHSAPSITFLKINFIQHNANNLFLPLLDFPWTGPQRRVCFSPLPRKTGAVRLTFQPPSPWHLSLS